MESVMISTRELAALLGMSGRTFARRRRALAADGLPQPIMPGAQRPWHRPSIEAWLAARAAGAIGNARDQEHVAAVQQHYARLNQRARGLA